jgi:hypothetical protein
LKYMIVGFLKYFMHIHDDNKQVQHYIKKIIEMR